ncbi:MAG: hypothetical protein FJY77_00750 [Candidatus Altiarchaeales archaeon]|nr:hypothetical protein [Candidatus Altiarchaeales archaeon]
MESDVPKGKGNVYVFFSLISAVMIVVSNVAFQQYALYKLEVERLEQNIDVLGGEYSKSVMMESVIEIKNTLINSQLSLLSQRNVLECVDRLLAREYGFSDNTTSEEVAFLLERNRFYEDLLAEVANTSAFVSTYGTDLESYNDVVSKAVEDLKLRKEVADAKGRLVWNVGLLLVVNVLVLTLYSLYLSQIEAEPEGLEYTRRIKLANVLQVLLGLLVIFGSFVWGMTSQAGFYLMNLMLLAIIVLMVLQAVGYFASRREAAASNEP